MTDAKHVCGLLAMVVSIFGCESRAPVGTEPHEAASLVSASAVGPPFISVTPDGATLGLQPNSSGEYTFTVSRFNPFSSDPTIFNLVCSTSGSVTCTGLNPPRLTLSSGQSLPVVASYTFSSGTGRLVLTACDGPGLPGVGPCALASYLDSGYVEINPPPKVTISGTTSVSNPGTYTWTANATGGDGTYGYRWAYHPSGSATWLTLGTAMTQSRYVTSSTPPFSLKVTVTSATQEGNAAISVDNMLWEPPCLRAPCPK